MCFTGDTPGHGVFTKISLEEPRLCGARPYANHDEEVRNMGKLIATLDARVHTALVIHLCLLLDPQVAVVALPYLTGTGMLQTLAVE